MTKSRLLTQKVKDLDDLREMLRDGEIPFKVRLALMSEEGRTTFLTRRAEAAELLSRPFKEEYSKLPQDVKDNWIDLMTYFLDELYQKKEYLVKLFVSDSEDLVRNCLKGQTIPQNLYDYMVSLIGYMIKKVYH
ncbi:MAG: hypothetical protein LBL47_02155 [Lactobacillus sp.]|jgi:hypothetical protein|nr:hypothetical protein [Lactobacillus sp.]